MDETPIEVVPYDPEWPRLYEAEADRLRDALGDRLARVEHIGSTAVPGLAAKPVLDVRAMARPDADLRDCVAVLERETGYLHGMDGWELLRREGGGEHVTLYNLHLTTLDGGAWRENVMLREYLRDHPDVREEYAAAKRAAAAAHPDDVQAYTEAKREVVESALRAAREADYDERV